MSCRAVQERQQGRRAYAYGDSAGFTGPLSRLPDPPLGQAASNQGHCVSGEGGPSVPLRHNHAAQPARAPHAACTAQCPQHSTARHSTAQQRLPRSSARSCRPAGVMQMGGSSHGAQFAGFPHMPLCYLSSSANISSSTCSAGRTHLWRPGPGVCHAPLAQRVDNGAAGAVEGPPHCGVAVNHPVAGGGPAVVILQIIDPCSGRAGQSAASGKRQRGGGAAIEAAAQQAAPASHPSRPRSVRPPPRNPWILQAGKKHGGMCYAATALVPAPTSTASTHQRETTSQPTSPLTLTRESSTRVASRIAIDTELQALFTNVAAQSGHARGERRLVGSQTAVDPGGLRPAVVEVQVGVAAGMAAAWGKA